VRIHHAHSALALVGATVLFMATCGVRAADLVLHYDFNEGSGTALSDLSGTGNDGTITSDAAPQWVAGVDGTALNFDGTASNTWVSGGNDASVNITGAHSIAYWLKWDGAGASWSPLIGKRPAGGGHNPQNYFTFLESDGTWFYCGAECAIWETEAEVLTGQWVHLAVTQDGGDEVRFYIGGQLVNTLTSGVGALADGNLTVGNGVNGPAAEFGGGAIDELQIYTRALSAQEISDLAGGIVIVDGVGPFLRGDCNQDGSNTGQVTDAIYLLTFLFLGGPAPDCLAACDFNGDGGVPGDPTDTIVYLNFNFLGRTPMPSPLLQCAVSEAPGDVALGCAVPAGCAVAP